MLQLPWKPFALTLSIAIFAACASSPQTISQDQIAQAETEGNLAVLYQQLTAALLNKDRNNPKNASVFAQLDDVGDTLATKQISSLQSRLDSSKLVSGLYPLSTIIETLNNSNQVKEWSVEQYTQFTESLNAVKLETETVISEQQELVKSGPLKARLDALLKLEGLTGEASYREQHDQEIAQISNDFKVAKEGDDLEAVKKYAEMILEINPDDNNAVKELVDVDTKLYENRFYQALENDDPDAAYEQFKIMVQSKHFEELKKSFKDIGGMMASYFVELAGSATQRSDYVVAYNRYSQARHVKNSLGLSRIEPAQTDIFVEKMLEGVNSAKGDELFGASLGYLYVAKETKPNDSSLRGLIREVEEAVLSKAMKKVSSSAFKNAAGSHEYGSAISSKITQRLFEKIPNDVRVIDRDDFEAIQREQKLKGSDSMVAVDFLISGSILEAKVDTSEKQGRKTMRVVTAKEMVPNPDHASWMQLSAKKRKKQAEPAKELKKEQQEDVTINIAMHRKVGIFSVSYRLIDAVTGKVIFPDSITLSEEYIDESSEGVELGNFSLPFKLASLPSDIEILDELSGKISEQASVKLVEKLKEPETRYRLIADRYAEEGNYVDASEQIAYALAITAGKGLETRGLREQLKTYAVSTGLVE